jgi:hypothetical protein
MNGRAADDLLPVSVMRYGNKMCFYGNGPIRYILSNYTTKPHFTREFNPYSQEGCYFLTEESTPEQQVPYKTQVVVTDYVNTPSSLNFFYYEKELWSVSNSGKEMLGEDFTETPLMIDYNLPNLADSTIVVHSTIAAVPNKIAYANAVIHSGGGNDTTVYTASSSRIYKPSSDYVLYNYASPYAELKLTHPSEQGQYEPIVLCDSTVAMSRLDYFILTYTQRNVVREDADNQTVMAYAKPTGNERYMLPNASSTTQVWFINDPNSPMMMSLKPYNDAAGTGYSYFTS